MTLGFTGMARPAGNWDAALADIDSLFAKYAADHHAPGLVYGVVRQGELLHVRGIGAQDIKSTAPVSADTVFRIASLTKSFTALAILNLRDEGRLDLDATASGLVPQLKVLPVSGGASPAIRLRHLLNHTAGFVTDDPWGDRQLDMTEAEFSSFLGGGIPTLRSPGEAFEYSNTGYAVLGRVISTVSKQPYQAYITQRLLRPLGLSSTFWESRDVPAQRRATGYSWVGDHLEEQPSLSDGAFGAMGGLSTSARDYGRYVAWLLAAWSEKSVSVPGSIDPATVREAGHPLAFSETGQRSNGPHGKPCPVTWMYGAGFYVVNDCELGTMLRHPGGLPGFGSQLLLLPHAGVGIFAFANLTYAHLSDPVVEAAGRLKRANLFTDSQMAAGPALLRAADAALQMYQSGNVEIARDQLAANLLLDIPARRRNAALRSYRESLGDCTAVTPSEILHAMAGRFKLACARGTMEVAILLSPTTPPKIQLLEFESRPAAQSHGAAP